MVNQYATYVFYANQITQPYTIKTTTAGIAIATPAVVFLYPTRRCLEPKKKKSAICHTKTMWKTVVFKNL